MPCYLNYHSFIVSQYAKLTVSVLRGVFYLGLLIALKYTLLVLKVLPKSTYNSCLYGEKAKLILNYIMQQNDLCEVTVI